MTRRRQLGGFTLIEVMAAIVFIAIVLPVAMRAISLAVSTGAVAAHRAEAATLAHSKLNEIVATSLWRNGAMAGDFAPEHPEYRWSAVLQNWDTSTLQELDVTVSWTSPRGDQTVQLSTLLETQSN